MLTVNELPRTRRELDHGVAGTNSRSAQLAELWHLYREMKTDNPHATDREVVELFNQRQMAHARVTTKTLRALRYRRRKLANV